MKYNYDLNARDVSCKMSNYRDMKGSLIFLSIPLRIILHTHKTNTSSVTWWNYTWYMTCTITYISVSVGSVYTKGKIPISFTAFKVGSNFALSGITAYLYSHSDQNLTQTLNSVLFVLILSCHRQKSSICKGLLIPSFMCLCRNGLWAGL